MPPARKLGALAGACLAIAVAAPAAHAVAPTPLVPSGPVPSLPESTGKPAKPQPVPGVRAASQNPQMAPDPKNNVHNDSWMTDNYSSFSGPLGKSPENFSTAFGRVCITLTFDSKGRLFASCTDLAHGPALYLFDPTTLEQLAFMQLPYIPPPANTNPAQNTTGGAYFYLNASDQAVVATSDRRILVVGETERDGQPAFETLASYDPTPCLPADERMPSVLPDYQGR